MKYTVGLVLLFWKEVTEAYPNLAMVAPSASIERTLLISGLLISSRRSRLGFDFVEMVMFLNINPDKLACDTEDFISTAEAKAYLCRKYKRCTDYDDEEDNGNSSATFSEIDNLLGEREMDEDEEDAS